MEPKMFKLCCRTCLKQTNFSELRSIFDTYDGFVIRDALQELFQIEVHQTDMLPTICNRCLSKLCSARDIRTEFLAHSQKYQQMIGSVGSELVNPHVQDSSEPEPSASEAEPAPAVESTTKEPNLVPFYEVEVGTRAESKHEVVAGSDTEDSIVYILERIDPLDDQDSQHLGYELKLMSNSPDVQKNANYEVVECISNDSNIELSSAKHTDKRKHKPDDSGTVKVDSSDVFDVRFVHRSITAHNSGDIAEEDNSVDVVVQYNCHNCDNAYESLVKFQEHSKSCTASRTTATQRVSGGDRSPRPETERVTRSRKTRANVEESFDCRACGATFDTRRECNQHCRQFHGTPQLSAHERELDSAQGTMAHTRHACHVCTETFARESQLLRHGRVIHGVGFKVLRPGDLDPPVKKPSTASKSRTLQKRFQCRFCPKSFFACSSWVGHENTHTRQQSFACTICGRSFAQYTSMRRHIKIHTETKSHECDFCHKRFRQRTVMLAHRRCHTGEKPYQCEVCLRCFRDHSTLSKHKRLHSQKTLEVLDELEIENGDE